LSSASTSTRRSSSTRRCAPGTAPARQTPRLASGPRKLRASLRRTISAIRTSSSLTLPRSRLMTHTTSALSKFRMDLCQKTCYLDTLRQKLSTPLRRASETLVNSRRPRTGSNSLRRSTSARVSARSPSSPGSAMLTLACQSSLASPRSRTT